MDDPLHQVLEKRGFWQTIHIMSWVARFIKASKKGKKYQLSGSLTINLCQTDKQVKFWVERAQNSRLNTDTFREDQFKLNLHKNEESLYECRGRIQGIYAIYLPPDGLLTERIVHDRYTMSFVRQQYWVPQLRQLTKTVIRGCYGCKKFQVTAFSNPPAGKLPRDRTEGSAPFQVVGLDFAGPIGYKLNTKKNRKSIWFVICLQLNQSCPPGVAAKSNS